MKKTTSYHHANRFSTKTSICVPVLGFYQCSQLVAFYQSKDLGAIQWNTTASWLNAIPMLEASTGTWERSKATGRSQGGPLSRRSKGTWLELQAQNIPMNDRDHLERTRLGTWELAYLSRSSYFTALCLNRLFSSLHSCHK